MTCPSPPVAGFLRTPGTVLEALGPGAPRSSGESVLVLLSGLPGAGKTTFAARPQHLDPAVLSRSDRFRGWLVRAQPRFLIRERAPLCRVRGAAASLLDKGAIVIDATNVTRADSGAVDKLAERRQARLMIVALEAPAEEIERRRRGAWKSPKAVPMPTSTSSINADGGSNRLAANTGSSTRQTGPQPRQPSTNRSGERAGIRSPAGRRDCG